MEQQEDYVSKIATRNTPKGLQGIQGIFKQLQGITSLTQHSDCIKPDNKALSSFIIKNETGTDKELVYLILEPQLIDLFDWFGTELSEEKARQIAIKFYSENYFLKLEEVKLFFEKIKSGCFGKSFGKLTPITFFEYVNAFVADSMRLRTDARMMEHENIKTVNNAKSSISHLYRVEKVNGADKITIISKAIIPKPSDGIKVKTNRGIVVELSTDDEFKQKKSEQIKQFKDAYNL